MIRYVTFDKYIDALLGTVELVMVDAVPEPGEAKLELVEEKLVTGLAGSDLG